MCLGFDGAGAAHDSSHLDHSDHPLAHTLGMYLGPSHWDCNQAARNQKTPKRTAPPQARALQFFDTKR